LFPIVVWQRHGDIDLDMSARHVCAEELFKPLNRASFFGADFIFTVGVDD